jgi:hypothetical protein
MGLNSVIIALILYILYISWAVNATLTCLIPILTSVSVRTCGYTGMGLGCTLDTCRYTCANAYKLSPTPINSSE